MPDDTLDWFVKKYSKLIGKQVVQVAKSDDEEPFYGLVFDDGTVAWIQCDPEGNGPGFLQLQA